MKNWFFFFLGLIPGIFLGAYLTAFLFFDDVMENDMPPAIKATPVDLYEKASTKKTEALPPKKEEPKFDPPLVEDETTPSLEDKPKAVPAGILTETVTLEPLSTSQNNKTNSEVKEESDD